MKTFLGTMLVASTLCASPAFADECLSSSEAGQLARKDGKYKEARAEFRVCAEKSCPDVVVKDCVAWLEELEAKQPSVLVEARARNGEETGRVAVYVDGEKVADRLEGRPIELDPGEHLLVFESPEKQRIEQRIVVRESEKSRHISVDFSKLARPKPKALPPAEHTPAPAPVEPSSGPPAASWWLGAAGIVAMGVGSYFLIAGKSDENDLEKSCSPRCPHDDVDAVRNKYRIGGITLGLGAVIVTASVILGVTSSPPARSGRLERFAITF